MRHLAIALASAALAMVSMPAWAREPSPEPAPDAATAPTPAQPVCTISAPDATELSGLVATDNGYVAINDSRDDPAAMRIFFFDRACGPIRSIGYPSPARDPEDLAVAADGTLWVADIGDNLTAGGNNRRTTIALWKLSPTSNTPVIYRLTYPDGPHDAEALVLNRDGTPVIVTKEPSGVAGVYVSSGPLRPNTTAGVPLNKIGDFSPRLTGTANFLGAIGQVLVTGGANAPDGARVALRTYADAYEWDVPDGDVAKAITTGSPRITPLPGEPQGESIAYTRDGAGFLTVSDREGPTTLLRYQSVSPGPTPLPTPTPTAATATAHRSLFQRMSLGQVFQLTAAVGILGLILAGVGVVGVRRSRRTRRG